MSGRINRREDVNPKEGKREYGDGDAKDPPRTVAVGEPAAERQETCKAEDVGRDRKMQPDRTLVQRARHRRKRSCEDRRVERLHEQRHRNDQRYDYVAWESVGRLLACSFGMACRVVFAVDRSAAGDHQYAGA